MCRRWPPTVPRTPPPTPGARMPGELEADRRPHPLALTPGSQDTLRWLRAVPAPSASIAALRGGPGGQAVTRLGVDQPSDMVRISAYARKHHRGKGVLEAESAEEQSRRAGNFPAILRRPSVRLQHREVDPVESLPEPRRPDDGCHVDHGAVLQQRHAVLGPDEPRDVPHNPAGGEVLPLDPQHRPAMESDVRHGLTADWGAPSQHVPSQEQEDRKRNPHPTGLEFDRYLPAVPATQDGRM